MPERNPGKRRNTDKDVAGETRPAPEIATVAERRPCNIIKGRFQACLLMLRRLPGEWRRQNHARRDYEFLPSALEVLERPPAPMARALIQLIALLAIFVTLWAFLSHMDIVVNANGLVVPKGRVKVVQSLEPALVTAIHIHEGQRVEEGALLLTMDETETRSDLNTIRQELLLTNLTVARLEAQLQDSPDQFVAPAEANPADIQLHRQLLAQTLKSRKELQDTLHMEMKRSEAELATINSNVARLEKGLPIAEQLYAKKRKMLKKGLIPEAEFLQAKLDMNDLRQNLETERQRRLEVDARLAKTREEQELDEAEYRRTLLKEITEVRTKKDNLHLQMTKAENRRAHQELRAPATGIVQQLAIHTVGAVVTAAQPLMVIVPLDSGLEVEAKVLNRDIGLVRANQLVSIKVTAYPFTRFGDLEGRIEWVAMDAVMDNQLGPVYPIRIAMEAYSLPNRVNGHQGVLSPGMTVTADVKVGRRRVIDYFLGPILRYRDTSLREF